MRRSSDAHLQDEVVRSIILFRRESRAYFVYGFAKSDRSNIRKDELEAFRKLASELLDLDDAAIEAAMANETIMEVKHD